MYCLCNSRLVKSYSFPLLKCTFNKFWKSTNLRRTMRTKMSTGLKPIKMSYMSYESVVSDAKKPPVIIMHGVFGSKSNWNSLSKTLHNMTKRKIIAVDARNHGDSPHTPEHSYPLMAEDVRFLMEHLDVKEASLVGHSMGGRTMMYFALVYPELVESLIPVEISLINNKEINEIIGIINFMRTIKLNANESIIKVRQFVDEQMKDSIKNPPLRDFLLANLIRVDNSYQWRINLESIYVNLKRNLALCPPVESMFYGPTYFIAGENSTCLKPVDHEIIKQTMFPLAKFKYIPSADHWLSAEKPIEFSQLVSQILLGTV